MSTGNAGVPCHDLATVELTERGQEQAREVAASWTQAPALIVTSPYRPLCIIRTQMIAQVCMTAPAKRLSGLYRLVA